MPPRPKVTREELANAAFRLVREKGEHALTAKTLAKEAGCSTQPIFWYFSGMAEVADEVKTRAKETFAKRLREKREGVNPFKTVGLNYIAFAREETNLFKMLYMSGTAIPDLLSDENTPFAVDVIVKEKGISSDDARHVFRELWLFSHGIATMEATGTARFSDEEVEEMLTDVYLGVLSAVQGKKTIKKQILIYAAQSKKVSRRHK